MDETPNLALPYILAAQAQKHVTHNEAIRALDALVQMTVLDRNLAAPPASPVNGDRYIVAASPTGAWAGHALDIAAYQDGAWIFYEPKEGWLAWVADENLVLAFDGAAWGSLPSGGGVGTFTQLGVNATPDATNKLSVASAASLFSNIGNGHQVKVNKAAAADTASLLFQTAFSGRAEMGTTGNDDFSVKVSPDGSAFLTALQIAAATGVVTFPQGIAGGGRLKSFQTFSAAGAATWTRPAGIRSVLVFCQAAGGGGGGATGVVSTLAAAAGGGAGGLAIKLVDVSAIASVAITNGAGGTAGLSSGGTGGTGGATNFGAHCSATGGAGGAGQTAGSAAGVTASGAGGVGSTGLLNLTGPPGVFGERYSATIGFSGAGGGAPVFGGGGPGQVAGNAAGVNGNSPGSGGGGAVTVNNATSRAGGVGAAGLVWVWEFE